MILYCKQGCSFVRSEIKPYNKTTLIYINSINKKGLRNYNRYRKQKSKDPYEKYEPPSPLDMDYVLLLMSYEDGFSIRNKHND